jgi:hypothetical protein
MNGSTQPLLVGPSGANAATGVHWTSSNFETSVNSCFSQQLVATSAHDLLLFDASSQYPLLRSTSSGATWTNIALPLIPGTNYGEDSVPLGNSLLLAPDGSVFAAVTTPSGQQELYRLSPAATSWCRVPRVFASDRSGNSLELMRASATELLWTQTNVNGTSSSMHVAPFAALTC